MKPSELLSTSRGLSKRKLLWLLLVVGLSAAGFGVVSKLQSKSQDTKTADTAAKEKAPTTLEFTEGDIAVVSLQSLAQSLSISGSLAPITQATVKSTVAGEVRRVLVREGEAVRQGAVLVEIDVTDARTRLDAALADQAERRARLDMAARNRDTNLGLLKQNFISQNAFDQLQSTLQASQAAVQWADAQVKLARKAIDDAVVRAPMAGMVAKRLVNGGERVMPDAPLLQLVDLSHLELDATLPASDMPRVALGQTVRFNVDGFGERAFEGKVDRINPLTEAGSRAIKLFVTVPNPQAVLRGGMFAQGRVSLSEATPTPVIPATAVFEEAGQSYVFTVLDNKLVKQAVTMGLKDEASGQIAITQGMLPGQQVVRLRMTGLKAGVSVVMSALPAVAASQPI
jgi:RND family efflux transporter MFP subunit